MVTEIEFWTIDNRNRMIALAVVLGAEILDIDNLSDIYPGTIRVAHAENIDMLMIAAGAGISDDPCEDCEDDDEDVIAAEGGSQGQEPADKSNDTETKQ